MPRYECYIEEATVYVEADGRRVEVGPMEDVYRRFGEEYEIEYSDWVKQRYDISFADEGLVMDVAEALEAMTLDEDMVAWLERESLETEDDSYFESGRMALFTGFLSHDLKHGPM